MNPTHRALRDGTAAAHDRVDAAFAGFDLTDRNSYARFLAAHAEIVWSLEPALAGERVVPDWEARKRGGLLREDLAFLRDAGATSRDLTEDWDLHTLPEIAGTLYVLEGSRLGGKFLARQLPVGFPRAYLGADQAAGNWRILLDRLDSLLYEDAALQSALAAAHRAFAAFERSALRWTKG